MKPEDDASPARGDDDDEGSAEGKGVGIVLLAVLAGLVILLVAMEMC